MPSSYRLESVLSISSCQVAVVVQNELKYVGIWTCSGQSCCPERKRWTYLLEKRPLNTSASLFRQPCSIRSYSTNSEPHSLSNSNIMQRNRRKCRVLMYWQYGYMVLPIDERMIERQYLIKSSVSFFEQASPSVPSYMRILYKGRLRGLLAIGICVSKLRL